MDTEENDKDNNNNIPSVKEEFQFKFFGLTYDKPHHLSLPEWRCPNDLFMAWRAFWAIWWVGWMIRSYQAQFAKGDGAKWYIYLTNWSLSLLTLQSVLHFCLVITSRCKGKVSDHDFQEQNSLSWLEKLTWLVTPIAFDLVLLVTIIYWPFVFEGGLTKALPVVTHAVTSFYVITDILISASPIRLLHMVYPAMYGILYVIFSLIYYGAGGTNDNGDQYIYSILDWSNPGMTTGVVLGLIFLLIPIIHLLAFKLYTLRLYLSQILACGRGRSGDDKAVLARLSEKTLQDSEFGVVQLLV